MTFQYGDRIFTFDNSKNEERSYTTVDITFDDGEECAWLYFRDIPEMKKFAAETTDSYGEGLLLALCEFLGGPRP